MLDEKGDREFTAAMFKFLISSIKAFNECQQLRFKAYYLLSTVSPPYFAAMQQIFQRVFLGSLGMLPKPFWGRYPICHTTCAHRQDVGTGS